MWIRLRPSEPLIHTSGVPHACEDNPAAGIFDEVQGGVPPQGWGHSSSSASPQEHYRITPTTWGHETSVTSSIENHRLTIDLQVVSIHIQ